MEKTPEKLVYTTVATTTGGREGHADGVNPDFSVSLKLPPEMGGHGGGTNPEQLFAMGYGACFQGALGLASKALGIAAKDTVVRVTVGIGPEGESFAIAVKIEVHIPGISLQDAQRLTDKTHELCPYSKATRGNVPVEVRAVESL